MRSHDLGAAGEPRFSILFHPGAEKEFLALPAKVQARFERAIDAMEHDPFTRRPGVDLKKLADLGRDASLHRLRVGKHRACYAVVTAERQVWVLLFERRGVGYDRMARAARERFRGRG